MAASSRSTASHVTRVVPLEPDATLDGPTPARSPARDRSSAGGTGPGGAPPGRCHATRSIPSRERSSIKWLPANPAPPVTRIALAIGRVALPRHPVHRAVERRKVPESREGERKKEAVIGRHGGGGAVVIDQVLERDS